MSKKSHHHGENVHKMEEIPERTGPKGPAKSPDLLRKPIGNLPPAELKRITHPAAKRPPEKPSNQTQK